MKKFPFILILAAVLGGIFTSCFKDDDPTDEYADWRIDNVAWYEEQAALSDYYTKVTAPWDPNAQVLMHWFNDTSITKNNLKPSTSPADSLFRCRLNSGVIQGWGIAIPRMHIGDSCRVIVPYNVGYGTTTSGDIKPFSTLQFDIKLVGIPAYEQ